MESLAESVRLVTNNRAAIPAPQVSFLVYTKEEIYDQPTLLTAYTLQRAARPRPPSLRYAHLQGEFFCLVQVKGRKTGEKQNPDHQAALSTSSTGI